MKIGILTFHKPINYGAFLQSFSLCSKLNELGFDAEIIDYIAPKEKSKVYINILWTLKHYGLNEMKREILKVRSFRHSLRYLKTSHRKFCTNNLEKLYTWIDNNYDILVIGSDAVFNWHQNGFPSAFIPDHTFKRCRVMTYAASVHGMRYLEEPQAYLEQCRKSFNNTEFIGVRDLTTENFVKACSSDSNPIHCCDPTLFINTELIHNYASNYRERIIKKYRVDLSKKYIVVMLPDSELIQEIVNTYGEKYQLITLFKPSRYIPSFLYDLNPFEWASVIKDAELVITSYFHGTLLSLVQNTPAVVIDYSGFTDNVYEGKLRDLMVRRLELNDLLFDAPTSSSEYNAILAQCDRVLEENYEERIGSAISRERNCFDAFSSVL